MREREGGCEGRGWGGGETDTEQTDIEMGRWSHYGFLIVREEERQTDRETDRQTNRQTGSQRETQRRADNAIDIQSGRQI